MADYSGYAPRQQQRQDPWADAAVGIAKLFMPDQETQLKNTQLRQQNEIGDLRLKNADAESKAADARAIYDADRISEANAQRAFQEERGRIMADAAKNKGILTSAQASRLAYLNSRLGGYAAQTDRDVAGVFGMTKEGQEAARAAAEAKAAAETRAAQEKAAAEAQAKAKAEAAAAQEKFYAGKAEEAKGYKPPSDGDMANAFKAAYRSISGGRRLSEGAISELVAAAQRGQFTGTPAQIADKILKLAFAGSHSGHVQPKLTGPALEKLRKDDPVAAADRELEDDFLPTSTTSTAGARKNLATVQRQFPGTYYIEGTMEEIRQQILGYPPGTRIVYLDVNTGKHGGGLIPTDDVVYQQMSDSPDGLHGLSPWYNAGIAPEPRGPTAAPAGR